MIKIEFIKDKWFLCKCKCLDDLYKAETKIIHERHEEEHMEDKKIELCDIYINVDTIYNG